MAETKYPIQQPLTQEEIAEYKRLSLFKARHYFRMLDVGLALADRRNLRDYVT